MVTIQLSLAPVDASRPGRDEMSTILSSVRIGERTTSSRPTILCVDDDPDITQSVQKHLSIYRVNVVCENCGKLGVWDVYRRNPNLIITDLRMPDGDGMYLLEQVRSNTCTARIPIIVMTGMRSDDLPGRMKNLGVASFLTKPVPFQKLLCEIGKYISLEVDDRSEETVKLHS